MKIPDLLRGDITEIVPCCRILHERGIDTAAVAGHGSGFDGDVETLRQPCVPIEYGVIFDFTGQLFREKLIGVSLHAGDAIGSAVVIHSRQIIGQGRIGFLFRITRCIRGGFLRVGDSRCGFLFRCTAGCRRQQ